MPFFKKHLMQGTQKKYNKAQLSGFIANTVLIISIVK